MGITSDFWRGKRIFLTGHTGFKGAWLSLWLSSLGAETAAYSLPPPTRPSLFDLCALGESVTDIRGDVRDRITLEKEMLKSKPQIVFHMAAQSLVRCSYQKPAETYDTNVMGTVNLFEAARKCRSVKAVVIVTSDKCYHNREWPWGYREDELLGGIDPYSSSKACVELVTAAYRESFFNTGKKPKVLVASARAGNVIGGGDWAEDRLVPDFIRSLLNNMPLKIRNPRAIRPWQHVLEPLSGYLLLAEGLFTGDRKFAGAWNFGPRDHDARPVEWIVKRMCEKWGKGARYTLDRRTQPHEAHCLKLDNSKARALLGWSPRWDIERAIDMTLAWTRAYKAKKDLRKECLRQIKEYTEA